MKRVKTFTILIGLFTAAVSAQVTFVQQPTMVSNGSGGYTITFQVSQNTDVEVSIVNVAQAKVIRHLAAGVLGTNPPAPLAANSLSQTLTWDGKDDFGVAVASQGLNARVRAGASPKLVNLLGENLYSFGSGTPTILTAPSGSVYMLGKAGGLFTFIRKYDASGNYIKTIFPPSALYPSDSMKGWGINVITGGGWWVPKTNQVLGVGIQFSPYNPTSLIRITSKGGIVFGIVTGGQYVMDTNGVFVDTASTALLKEAVEAKPAVSGVNPALAAGPKLPKEFAAFHDGPFVFERVAVDRTNEHVYWNNAMEIPDPRNPAPRQMGMTLDNITVGPRGNIYGWTDGTVYNVNPIVRYASDNAHLPAPYGNTGANQATSGIYFEYGFAGTHGNHRGIAVGWQKQIAAFAEVSPLFQVADTGGSASTPNNVIQGNFKALLSLNNYIGTSSDGNISMLGREVMCGVRYDPAGNFYVGIKKLAPKPVFPAGMGLDPAFRNSGSVVKFSKDSAGTMDCTGANLTGYSMIFPQTFGPFTLPAIGGTIPGTNLTMECTCRSSQFDVDPYGRLYIPNGVTCQVYMADNAGNTISAFGQYGNTDARGGLSGPGQISSKPDIPLAWPTSVAASEDFIYVADAVNARLARVQMVYAIDNFPGLTEHNTGVEKGKSWKNFTLTSAPNPFNPESRISVSLPAASNINLDVYDVSGRRVRTLASENLSAGVHCFTWDAKDNAGRSVSAGVYVYKLTAGKQVMVERTVLAK